MSFASGWPRPGFPNHAGLLHSVGFVRSCAKRVAVCEQPFFADGLIKWQGVDGERISLQNAVLTRIK